METSENTSLFEEIDEEIENTYSYEAEPRPQLSIGITDTLGHTFPPGGFDETIDSIPSRDNEPEPQGSMPQNHMKHSLLTLPAELRLGIYEHLTPLDANKSDLKGLVLSCRTIKEEVYYETKKMLRKIDQDIQSRWPAGVAEGFKVYSFITPGGLLSKQDIVVEVPYLTHDELTEFWCRPSDVADPLVFPDIYHLKVRIVRVDDANDSGWDSFTVDEKNSHLHRLMFAYRRAMVGPEGECASRMLLDFQDKEKADQAELEVDQLEYDGEKWTSEFYVFEYDSSEYVFPSIMFR
jgi:hypothetical protein